MRTPGPVDVVDRAALAQIICITRFTPRQVRQHFTRMLITVFVLYGEEMALVFVAVAVKTVGTDPIHRNFLGDIRDLRDRKGVVGPCFFLSECCPNAKETKDEYD